MPSTYTTRNGIELIATGEQSGTWGDTTNTNLSLIDTALDGQVTITLASAGSSGSPNTLPITDGAASNGRNRLIIFSDGGDLGATAYVQLTPNDAEKIVYVRNDLSGSRSILLFQGTYSASNDYEVPAGTTAVVFFDGGGAGAVAANVFNNAHFDALNVVGTVSATTGNITTVNATTVDTTNVEVTNIKAKDGTAAATIADSTGVVTIGSSVLTTADINGGTIDGAVIGGGTPAAITGTTITGTTITGTSFVSSGNMTFGDDDKIVLGTGSDLEIYHDGSNSIIDDAGTGDLQLKVGGTTKVSVTSTGMSVTGTALATTDTDTSNTGSVTLDFGANQNFVLTLTGNVTLDNPTTEQVGQSGFIVFIQDGTGGRTVSLGTDYETAGGAGLTLSSAASATDVVPYIVAASGRILLGAPQLAFS